jgi:hypothetical protein
VAACCSARSTGRRPNTLAEYGLNQYEGQDFIDISVVDGFNVPLDFLPADSTAGCPKGGPHCDADITAQFPAELQAPGGCNNACTVQGGPVLLHRVGGQQLRADGLLEVLQGAVPGRLQLPQGRRDQHLHLPRRHQLPGHLLPVS